MTYDEWKTSAPDPGRVEDVDGCADCGDLICTCDERCPGCMRPFAVCATKADAEAYGLCIECRMDAAESLRNEVA